MRMTRIAGVVLACAALTAACGQRGARADDANSVGYLTPPQVPDSVALVGPPPAAGSAALASDEATYRATRALEGQSRWRLAVRDAAYGADEMLDAYSCALGIALTTMEKAVQLYYERRLRGEGERSQSFEARIRSQLALGLDALDASAPDLWFETAPGHADFAVVCAFGALRALLGAEVEVARWPRLAAFCDRAETMGPFRAAPPQDGYRIGPRTAVA